MSYKHLNDESFGTLEAQLVARQLIPSIESIIEEELSFQDDMEYLSEYESSITESQPDAEFFASIARVTKLQQLVEALRWFAGE